MNLSGEFTGLVTGLVRGDPSGCLHVDSDWERRTWLDHHSEGCSGGRRGWMVVHLQRLN